MYKISNIKKSKLLKIQPLLDLGIINKQVWVAGGALQTLVCPADTIFDYDIFFNTLDQLRRTIAILESKDYYCIFKCPLGELYSYSNGTHKVQLITKFAYPTIADMLNSFDFQCTMWGYDGKDLYTTREAIRSSKKRKVTINKITYPVATLKRIFKYINNKLYTIDNDTLVSLVVNINTMDLDESNLIFYVD